MAAREPTPPAKPSLSVPKPSPARPASAPPKKLVKREATQSQSHKKPPRAPRPATARTRSVKARGPREDLHAKQNRSRRPVLSPGAVPGPGMYRIRGFADNNAQYYTKYVQPKPHRLRPSRPQSARARIQSTSTPGPGSYNPLHRLGHNLPGHSLKGSCARDDSHTMVNSRKQIGNSPGPAAYTPMLTNSSAKPGSTSILISKEGPTKKTPYVRGPGPKYNPPLPRSIPNAPKTRFGKAERTTIEKPPMVPGPGAYNNLNPRELGRQGINGHMGKPSSRIPANYGRPLPMEGDPNQSPGPAQYKGQNDMHQPLGQKGGKCTFGTARRFGSYHW